MVKISTDLGVNIGINDVPASKGVETRVQPAPQGKDLLQSLSEALGTVNPKIFEFVKQATDKVNEEEAVKGANKINGMTIEEARKAHQDGFPDIYNGWARVGAYKQYATNSNEEFSRTWKSKYFNNRGNSNYNWEEDYTKATQEYLRDKQDDPFFQEAFRKETNKTRDYIREKEFEFQNAELQDRIQTDAAYSIQTLTTKVEQQLDTIFRSTIPVEQSGKDFAFKKEEFVKQNFENEFIKQFYQLKANRNPAITNLDWDILTIKQANFHALTNGDFSGVFTKLLMEQRPDGTPPIIFNRKLQGEATTALENLGKSLQLQKFRLDADKNNLTNYSDSEIKKLSNDTWERTLRKNQAIYGDNVEAFDNSLQQMSSWFTTKPPIQALQEILLRPLSTTYNLDTQKAFALALRLDEKGALLRYFNSNENSKDSMKWFMAVQEFRAGKSREDIIKTLAQREQSKSLITINETDRKELSNKFTDININSVYNRDLIFNVSSYFKSLDPSGVKYIENTKNYIDKYYFKESNGTYVSRAKLQALGIGENNYSAFKNFIIDELKGVEYMSEKDKKNMVRPDFNEFTTTFEPDTNKLSGFKYNFNDYEFFINPDDKTAYFTEKNGVNYYAPIMLSKVVGYNRDKTPILENRRLEINLVPVLEKMKKIDQLKYNEQEEMNIDLAKRREKAVKEVEKYRAFISPAAALGNLLFE